MWSTDHDAVLRVAVAGGGSWAEIARTVSSVLGTEISEDSVRNRARRLGVERPGPTIDMMKEETLRRSDARDLRKTLQLQARWEDFLDVVRSELLLAAQPPAPLIAPSGDGTPETMLALLSDPHVGKLVDPATVGSNFAYGKLVFEARIREYAEGILRLRDIHSQRGPIPKLVLLVLGDLVDGVDMRRGHPHRVDIQTATEQTVLVARHLTWLVRELAPYFSAGVDVSFDFGNHGRIGDFGVNLPSDNFDWLASVMVRENLAGDEGVTVDVHTQKYSIHRIGPLNVYSAHGDAIRGGGASPVVKRHVANLQNLHRQVFDLVTLGHFHTPELYTAGGATILMNGAFEAGDDFAVNRLVAASDPVQWVAGVHPKRGLTWTYQLKLAAARPPTQGSQM
jgi:hypothetical protein